MPIYDFQCECGEEIKDQFFWPTEEAKRTCVCGADMERVQPKPGLITHEHAWAKKWGKR